MKSAGKEKEEKGGERELSGEELAKRGRQREVCAAVGDLFTDS